MLDVKGWMFILLWYCEVFQLQVEGWVIVIKYLDGCFMLFLCFEWECFCECIVVLLMEVYWWKWIFLGSVVDVEFDIVGCVFIILELCMVVFFECDVMLFGMGSYFEVWDVVMYIVKE